MYCLPYVNSKESGISNMQICRTKTRGEILQQHLDVRELVNLDKLKLSENVLTLFDAPFRWTSAIRCMMGNDLALVNTNSRTTKLTNKHLGLK